MCAQFAVAVHRLVQFLRMYIPQGSVATRFGCGGILNNSFIAKFPESPLVKQF